MTQPIELTGFEREALKAAKRSPCSKRKVGAVVLDSTTGKWSAGYNYNPNGGPCEIEGVTHPDVIHAEVAALKTFKSRSLSPDAICVTHQPCSDCLQAIQDAGIPEENIRIVADFMKFDSNKLQYNLIPPTATKALAEVLTYGAKKYKPENWRKGEADRYVAAAFRHFEAYRSGEVFDRESGLPHLAHLMTNIAFLIELDEEVKNHLTSLDN